MRRPPALLRYFPSRAILDHIKPGDGQVLREQKEVKAAAVWKWSCLSSQSDSRHMDSYK
jgi:hypothetical protein